MKEKILVFIIGLLVGAIISASYFLIDQNMNKNTKQIQGKEQMQMMERPADGQMPPEKPSGIEGDENMFKMPSKNSSSMDETN